MRAREAPRAPLLVRDYRGAGGSSGVQMQGAIE
jgi:hypothetical protein